MICKWRQNSQFIGKNSVNSAIRSDLKYMKYKTNIKSLIYTIIIKQNKRKTQQQQQMIIIL